MAKMDFGGVVENIVTKDEFTLEKAREVLKNETIAVIGYGIQGPGQAGNLRDNGFNVIVGQRKGKSYDKAVADGWVPGKTLFSIEERSREGYYHRNVAQRCRSDFSVANHQEGPDSRKDSLLQSTVSLSTGRTAQALFRQKTLMSSW